METNLHEAYRSEAQVVHDSLDDNVGSIIVILMIISIMVSVIRMLQSCSSKKAVDFQDMDGVRGLVARNRIAKVVYKELGPELYKQHGTAVVDAVLARGKSIDTESFQKFLDSPLDD